MNYEEWRPNVLNLLNSRNYGHFIEKDYHPLIHRSHLYQTIKEQELFSFLLASTTVKLATSMIDAGGEKLGTAKQIKLQVNIKELTMRLRKAEDSKASKDEIEELCELIVLTEEELSMLVLSVIPSSIIPSSSAQLYPGKTDAEIEAHIKAVRELEEKSVKAHALISASLSDLLRNFVSHVEANPFRLWATLEERFRNRTVNLTANLKKFYTAKKETHEKLVDYNARLSQLCLLLSTSTYNINDEVYLTTLLKGLPSKYNATCSLITLQAPTLDAALSVLLNHERVLEQQETPSSSTALYTHPAGKHDNCPKRERKGAPVGQSGQGPSNAGGKKGNNRDHGGRGRGGCGGRSRDSNDTHNNSNNTCNDQRSHNGDGKQNKAVNRPSDFNGDAFCRHCKRPGHTIHVCWTYAALQTSGHGGNNTQAHVVTTVAPSREDDSADATDAYVSDSDYNSDDAVYYTHANKGIDVYLIAMGLSAAFLYPLPIFDTSCSGHITGTRDILHNLWSVLPSVV